MSKWLGPYVRLEGISINQLPPGGKGTGPGSIVESVDNTDSSPATTNLDTFVTAVLTESIPFIDGVAPKAGGKSTWKQKGSPKRYASSEAPVELYQYTIPGKELDKITGMSQFAADRKDETWFCRRSCHRNAPDKGTASWDEFVYSFKDHHHESEDAFTPTVIGAREAITWDTNGITVEVHGEQWTDLTLKVIEMKHKIDPKPLKNRTFPVLQLAASLANTQELLVISIPLSDFASSPHCEYAKDKSLVVGAYASIERIRILPKTGEIEWIMATTSNAKGVLPQWLQNLSVAGIVAHDVELFLAWIPSQRKRPTQSNEAGNGKPAAPARQPTFDKSLPIPPAGSVVSVPPTPISKDPVGEEVVPKEPVLKEGDARPVETTGENKSLPPAPGQ